MYDVYRIIKLDGSNSTPRFSIIDYRTVVEGWIFYES